MIESLAIGAAVALGAAVQRSVALGMGLVVSPVVALILGPDVAAPFVNVVTVVVCAVGLRSVWVDVPWRYAAWVSVPAVAVVWPARWALARLDGAWVAVVAGLAIVVASMLLLRRVRARWLAGSAGSVSMGLLSGVLAVLSGTPGPPATVALGSAALDARQVIAGVQATSLVACAVAMAASGVPSVSASAMVAAGMGLLVGTAAGSWLARRVPAPVLVRSGLLVALVGGLVLAGRGLVAVV